MHSSAGSRRTSASLQQDQYDPKGKSNENQTLYVILAVIGAFIFVFILYKVFASSEPSSISQSNDNQEQYYEEAYAANEIETDDEVAVNDMNDDVDTMNMDDGGRRGDVFRKKDPFGFRKNKLFGSPFKDRGGLTDKIRRERDHEPPMDPRFDRDNFRGRMPPKFDPDKRRFDGMKDKLGRVGNLESYKDMMRQKRPFSEFGEGPIFNELNREDGANKMSPEELREARERFKGMGGLPGFDGRGRGRPEFGGRAGRPQQLRQRREEM